MDKQKEIEEMAKDLHSTHAVSAICSGKDCNHCKHASLKRFDDYTCIDLDLAEALYNADYRKIPKNAVVITKKDRERLNDVLRGALQRAEKWEKLCGIKIKETIKETAEKFAERLKEALGEFFDDNGDNDGKISKAICLIEIIGVVAKNGEVISLGLIDEIAKEITGEEK